VSHAPYALAAFIFAFGLWGVVHQRTMIGQVLALAVMQSSTYLLLLSIGYRWGGAAPILQGTQPNRTATVDPVVQALALTDVVVSATTIALLLVLVMRIAGGGGTLDPDQPSAHTET
jgi:multicomponent Na+:H+ antiporter subunit C